MVDNTILPSGTGGDTVRTVDRGTAKTQVVTLDFGGEAGPEILVTTTSGIPVQPQTGVTWAITATNLDVALSTRLKAADTLTGVTTVSTVSVLGTMLGGLPTGTNTIGAVSVVGTSTVSISGTSAVTVSGTANVAVTGTAAISGAVTVSGTAVTSRNWTLSTSSDSVTVAGAVTVGGTSTVAISGTPAVTLSGTGTVAISGTPTVTVGGTATVAGAVTVSGTSAVNVIGTAVISGAVTVTGTATTARTWALSTASDSVVISGSATVNTITGFALETGGNLATLAAAVVANDSASEPVNVMVVAGETNDAVPLSAALPLGPTGRSVLVEAYGTLPLPSGAAKESGGNLDYLARSIEQNNQIIKLLTAILVSIGNNGGGFIQPEEATELVTLQ